MQEEMTLHWGNLREFAEYVIDYLLRQARETETGEDQSLSLDRRWANHYQHVVRHFYYFCSYEYRRGSYVPSFRGNKSLADDLQKKT